MSTKKQGLASAIKHGSIDYISKKDLLYGVEKELEGRELFVESDGGQETEKIYSGSVFELILSEDAEHKKLIPNSRVNIRDNAVIKQLVELAKLVAADYVMITNITE